MTRNLFLANRIREVLLNGKWIANTNFKEQISNLSWEKAVQKIGNINSIAMLTFHINYYLDGLLKAFANGKLEINDRFSFDLQPITSAEDWNNLVKDFMSNAEKFANAVLALDNSRLDEIFIDKKYDTYLRNIEGVIEHSYYHLGQVVLIKKMLDLQ
ncbi:DUF1572 family protein [Pedobacter agri]|uniref:DUF1572 family protein n=1 Tax=Pedobacter agri TaxID=454586 RepID=UPI00278619E0|nr:DUF1572 family protein [Pedobacter agri]MDQ1141379.1 putative damage-inducible protein DinB [Pedobacter agri]